MPGPSQDSANPLRAGPRKHSRPWNRPSQKLEKPNIGESVAQGAETGNSASSTVKPVRLNRPESSFAAPAGKFASVADMSMFALPPDAPQWKTPTLSRPVFRQVPLGIIANSKVKPGTQKNCQSKTSEREDVANIELLRSLLNFDGLPEEENESQAIPTSLTDLKIPNLSVSLMPHQREGVSWMVQREAAKKYTAGGMLCDDMGLGKTVQSIALILYNAPPEKSSVKTTLIVGPLAVLDQWKSEVAKFAPKLRVTTHQGSRRTKSYAELARHDVVITTYETVASEYASTGPLYGGEWFRIIADEAHSFRNHQTIRAKAMLELKSDGRRWVLTGTPIHNSIMDLWTLVAFLQVRKYCEQEKFKEIAEDASNRRIKLLLRAVMKRRTQEILDTVLPPLTRSEYPVKLSAKELSIYQTYQPRLVDPAASNVMVMLVRMRQACDGLFSTPKHTDSVDSVQYQDHNKPISLEKLSSRKSGGAVLAKGNKTPKQDSTVTEFGSFADSTEDDDLTELLENLTIKAKKGLSGDINSKARALREILQRDASRKTVVFSSFVTMLRVLEISLDDQGVSYCAYEGSMSTELRQKALRNFSDPTKGIQVLLCSLTAAAVGLNITAASQVVMIEPWWNPQIVDQAVMRVHRLGQKQPVQCYEIFAEGTIEERMVAIQSRKRQLAKDLLHGSDTLSKEDRAYLLYGDADAQDTKSLKKRSGTENRDNNGSHLTRVE